MRVTQHIHMFLWARYYGISPAVWTVSLSDHQAITGPLAENMSSLHSARAGLMYLYGAGQLSSPCYTAQGTAHLQHVDLPLTWWPLSLLLIDLLHPFGPACGFLLGVRLTWRLSVCSPQLIPKNYWFYAEQLGADTRSKMFCFLVQPAIRRSISVFCWISFCHCESGEYSKG